MGESRSKNDDFLEICAPHLSEIFFHGERGGFLCLLCALPLTDVKARVRDSAPVFVEVDHATEALCTAVSKGVDGKKMLVVVAFHTFRSSEPAHH